MNPFRFLGALLGTCASVLYLAWVEFSEGCAAAIEAGGGHIGGGTDADLGPETRLDSWNSGEAFPKAEEKTRPGRFE